ncbi:GntR family transcriptional regulator [Salipiger sp. H15]|uniref:GntR family transcriptional regulator n=1 Tax=Alloyangia sp. H15 TaxID=3029062 RepID=A0AAU8AND0_9RHOB
MEHTAPTPGQTATRRRDGSLTQTVRARIETMILRGELSAGVRLNEQQLSDILGVSRGPVREALRLLASDGLVAVSTNQGAFVKQHTIEDALELYDLRALIAGYACGKLARRSTRQQREELAALVAEMEACLNAGDEEGYFARNLTFHDLIGEMSGAKKSAELYASLDKEVRLLRRRVLQGRESMAKSHEEHLRILDAIQARDPEAARRAAEEHHASGKQRWLDTLKGK